MVESRGGKEDRKLKDSYARLHQRGTDHIFVKKKTIFKFFETTDQDSLAAEKQKERHR